MASPPCPVESLRSPFENETFRSADQSSTGLMLIRHGHMAGNTGALDEGMAGWTDLPLIPRGRMEIERLRQHLARGPKFDAIYSSPLSRAVDTARLLVAAGLGPIRLCPELKEINCGEPTGSLSEKCSTGFRSHGGRIVLSKLRTSVGREARVTASFGTAASVQYVASPPHIRPDGLRWLLMPA